MQPNLYALPDAIIAHARLRSAGSREGRAFSGGARPVCDLLSWTHARVTVVTRLRHLRLLPQSCSRSPSINQIRYRVNRHQPLLAPSFDPSHAGFALRLMRSTSRTYHCCLGRIRLWKWYWPLLQSKLPSEFVFLWSCQRSHATVSKSLSPIQRYCVSAFSLVWPYFGSY